MKKKLFIGLILMAALSKLSAQTLKPGVLVIGNGDAAVAAALQSAISGAKTTLLLQAGGFDVNLNQGDLASGIQAQFLAKYRKALQLPDTAEGFDIDKQKANAVLKSWTDSTKNLTVMSSVMWVKADRSGNNWTFKLSDGSAIKPRVLITAGDEKLNQALKIVPPTTESWLNLNYANTLHRTSVGAGRMIAGTNANVLSMYQFFVPKQENLIWINDAQSMLLGQAAGATAAYAVFFDTKTSLSNLKKIQGELIAYKLALVPFVDVKTIDTNWRAIQMVALTGVIKAGIGEKQARFNPEQLVSTAELKQPIKDFFYKAQLWFDDYKSDKITIGAALELISYVGNKSKEQTKKELEKKWKTSYQFKTDFELNRQINRRELAAMLYDYMSPFNVNVDANGKVVR